MAAKRKARKATARGSAEVPDPFEIRDLASDIQSLFLSLQSLNSSSPEEEAKVAAKLRRFVSEECWAGEVLREARSLLEPKKAEIYCTLHGEPVRWGAFIEPSAVHVMAMLGWVALDLGDEYSNDADFLGAWRKLVEDAIQDRRILELRARVVQETAKVAMQSGARPGAKSRPGTDASRRVALRQDFVLKALPPSDGHALRSLDSLLQQFTRCGARLRGGPLLELPWKERPDPTTFYRDLKALRNGGYVEHGRLIRTKKGDERVSRFASE